MSSLTTLKKQVKDCTICKAHLPLGPNPVFVVDKKSKIIIIGQAPGRAVHNTSIPWNDKSGDNLRNWLQVSREEFYNPELFGQLPMGFCYPGTGKSGDLPPRKECAPQWHGQLLDFMNNHELILLVGLYAQKYYLQKAAERNLTETVRSYEKYLPKFIPLPHPSPRNNIWMKKNRWFQENLLPVLALKVDQIIRG